MIRYFFIFFFPVFLSAQTKFTFVKKEGGFKHPESVCIIDSETVFVADIGKEMRPSELDSDGVLYKCPLKHLSDKKKFNKNFKLNAPKGITNDKTSLYITDIDRIVIVDIATGEKTDEIVFTDKTVFLNDVAMLEENTLLVTATNQHDMYAVIIKSKEIFNLSKKSMEGANGICVADGKVYVCGFSNKQNKKGHLYAYDLETNAVTVIVDQIGHLDGLKMHNGKLIVSDWGGDFNHGKIWEVDIANKSASVISDNPDLKSPSDFDIYNNLLLVPCIDEGEILIFKWGD
ncbi:MAG TPA: hypothetical protein VNZ49_11145 [Bacteroidia bacterium]|jgi:hypothetical protein|nr:hypothetical protein [Bacteroidia bacterium]